MTSIASASERLSASEGPVEFFSFSVQMPLPPGLAAMPLRARRKRLQPGGAVRGDKDVALG